MTARGVKRKSLLSRNVHTLSVAAIDIGRVLFTDSVATLARESRQCRTHPGRSWVLGRSSCAGACKGVSVGERVQTLRMKKKARCADPRSPRKGADEGAERRWGFDDLRVRRDPAATT